MVVVDSCMSMIRIWVGDKKLVGESNSRLARYSSTKIGECMC